MKRTLSAFALMLMFTAPGWASAPTGHWEGAIELPTGELDIVVNLDRDDTSTWQGRIDIPAQKLRGYELTGVVVDGSQVRFAMAGIPGEPSFVGTVAESGTAISGTFTQGGQSLPFTLDRVGDAAPPTVEGLPEEPIPGEGVVGDWLGVLDVGPLDLRLALHVEAAADGALRGVLDSVDQSAVMTIDTISFTGEKLRFAVTSIAGSFEGSLNADGSAIAGTWSQSGNELPLVFHRLAERFALSRPQTPEAPFPYNSREVTFTSAAGDVELVGTLLLPHGKGPFPAVAMISGSGPQDRDETLMGHQPFLVIADALARRGIGSLRWDDRGFGASGGDHLGSSIDDFAADAAAAVASLAAEPHVDRGAIGLLGHSEGGLIAPRVAAANEEVDFLVLLAPMGVPTPDLLRRQVADIYRLQGLDAGLIDRAVAALDGDLALVADPELSTEHLREALRERARDAGYTAEERARLQLTDEAIEQGIELSTTTWFRTLVRQDPAAHLSRVTIPVLALFGDKDIQVAAEENAAAVRRALAVAENPDVDVRILPGLNHLFQPATTGGVEEYATIDTTFDPAALDIVGDWIEARFGR